MPVFWRVQIAGWGLFALLDVAARTVVYQDFATALMVTLLLWPVLVLAAAGLRFVFRRLGFEGRLSVGGIACIFALSAGTALAIVSATTLLRAPFGWSIPDWTDTQAFLTPFAYYTLIFSAWSLAYFWVKAEIARRTEQQRAAQAESEALRAELHQLILQLNPHFLFNALNGVAEEIPDNPKAALNMVRDLSAYLRHALMALDHPVVSVARETEALAAYLRIQEARFGARLRSHMDVEREALDRPIASVLLQPLLENAVEHGDRSDHLDLIVRIRTEGTALRVEIENNGVLRSAETTVRKRLRHTGIGLQNVRRRLALHYPGRHSFELKEKSISGWPDDCHHDSAVVAELLLEGTPCSVS
ncbi:sensor histidine kinase [Azorhizobium oxalatiphilum]|uniref:Sensor histidine kinase n=1 Tax=Azorhizobium oxalatiphilum TaxID=980631 RepID=A0A917FC42_9HYPH|nr:sensor histidine kinase [Azorhizobium oxalatiphilum]